jgi:transglutaminase-like putative cysteine protease
MSFLTVNHSTVYRYREPVRLGEHRMMFRPRASHDLRLIRTDLVITPAPAHMRWLHDSFDNSVAVATFDGTTSELRFESIVSLEHFDTTLPEYPLEAHARTYPFRYSDEDFPNLARALAPHYPGHRVAEWALRFLEPADRTGTMAMLRAMTLGIRDEFTYTRRVEKGVQTPEETLRLRRGSCRDLAVFMMEASRSLGVASRFVSGYIYTPEGAGVAGGGAMHAWMQAYLPGGGWIDFDPTNSIIGNRNLIRVAVAWAPEFVLPLWGTYSGPPGAFVEMDVNVSVTEVAG